jgi:cytochrome c-type biogenesis protein
MVSFALNIWISFLAGLFAPLGAVCVLPLYPGFLAYLANQTAGRKDAKKIIVLLGVLVTLGVIASMLLIGFIFTYLLKVSLTSVIGIISPIAFIILGLVSLLLIFNFDFSKIFPKFEGVKFKNPYVNSFIFGLFFGLIILPCNPASLAVLFAINTTAASLVNFLVFGIGMGMPLLVFAILSRTYSKQIIGNLIKYKRGINLFAGLIMLGISIYYLVFVFKVIG